MLPAAELKLEVNADDQQYAVRSVYLEYRTHRDETPRRLHLYDPAIGPAPLLAPWIGPSVLAAPPLAARPQRLDFRQKLSLKSIRHADGSSLKEEDVVFLRACADDYDDVNPAKEIGHSPEIEIRIVGRNALDIVLNQEQAGIQQELLRCASGNARLWAKSRKSRTVSKREKNSAMATRRNCCKPRRFSRISASASAPTKKDCARI